MQKSLARAAATGKPIYQAGDKCLLTHAGDEK